MIVSDATPGGKLTAVANAYRTPAKAGEGTWFGR
jgi:hypothetical protein